MCYKLRKHTNISSNLAAFPPFSGTRYRAALLPELKIIIVTQISFYSSFLDFYLQSYSFALVLHSKKILSIQGVPLDVKFDLPALC